jgi:hypothetical protein
MQGKVGMYVVLGDAEDGGAGASGRRKRCSCPSLTICRAPTAKGQWAAGTRSADKLGEYKIPWEGFCRCGQGHWLVRFLMYRADKIEEEPRHN